LVEAERGAIAALREQPGMRVNNRARDDHFAYSDEAVASDPQRRASGVRARAERVPSAPPSAAESERPLLSIGMPADEALLEPTYAYLSAYCFALFPPKLAQRLNVAIYELCANALRHGSGDGEVRVELRRNGDAVSLRVSNHAQPAQSEQLRVQIERVQVDPEAAFTSEMNRFVGASQPPPMLGIVRVAHEARLELQLRLDGGSVDVSTECA
jgi:signal transduction histidine kinase